MKTDMVKPILLAFTENAQPFLLVGRRITRLGEAAVFHRTSQEKRPVIEIELTSTGPDATQSEGGFVDFITRLNGQLVEMGGKLVPQLGIRSKTNGELSPLGVSLSPTGIAIALPVVLPLRRLA